MSYKVLARKWRPKNFAELVGQEHVVRALSNALEQNRLHHAYLLTGTRGVGKTTVARILAKSLNCETGITAKPCGICSACTEIDGGRFMDLIELDAASNTQVDSMRDLLENALYAPTTGRFKVYIIDEVHMLSKSAFNAMLKTLEEPPAHVKFVLATTDPQKIPVTVLSRCLQFNLKQIPPQVISTYLADVLIKENIPSEATALQLLARAAQGSMRDALSLLDQAIAYGAGKVEEPAVRSMLGAIDQTYLYEILNALQSGDGVRLIGQADDMAKRSLSFDSALQELGVILHTIALAQTVPQAVAEDTERAAVMALAAGFSAEEVQLFYQIVLQGRHDLSLAPDEYAGFTMTLLRMLAFAPEKSDATLKPEAPKIASPAPQPERVAAPRNAAPEIAENKPSPTLRSVPVNAAVAATVVHSVSPIDNPRVQFDGNWPALVGELKIGGMAKMLAQHCELKSHNETGFELCVPEAHKHLMEKVYQDKFKAALSEHFGAPINATLTIGSITGMTPAALDSQNKQAKQAKAIAAIEQDPFVRDLVENFDAKLIDSSIKPI